MHLIKWIRKNERKLMTFVVIFCMIAFVGGVGLEQFLSYLGHGGHNKIATCFEDRKISSLDANNASGELEVLSLLMADRFLMLKPGPFGQPDTNSQLLACLLFPEADAAARMRAQLRSLVNQGRLPFSMDDIENFFENESKLRPEIAWLLLNRETGRAGIAVSEETAKQILRQIIPPLTQNRIDAAQIVKAAVKQTNLSDRQIIQTFAKLMAVLNYADQIMDNEDVTIPQIRAAVARSSERIDTEFVKLDPGKFLEETNAPEPNRITAQFEKFKDRLPARSGSDNPFGFGYKLPKRIRLEYLVIKHSDAAGLIDKPTPDEMETHYSKNIARFTDSTPLDPNKPDGPKQTSTQPYAAVAEQIYSMLEQERTEKFIGLVYKDAREMLEAGFEKLNPENASTEQLQQAAPEYQVIADKLMEKHKIPVYTGKTGLLDAYEFSADSCLGGLRPTTADVKVPLGELLFAVDKTAQKQHRFFGAVVPRLWENIGPLAGGLFSEQDNQYHRLTAVLRVIDAADQQIPQNCETSYSIEGIRFGGNQGPKRMFSVKENVIKDLKTVEAFGIARKKADELAGRIQNKEWQQALDQYNSTIPGGSDPNNPQRLELASLKSQPVASELEIDNAYKMLDANPAAAGFIQKRLAASVLNRRLYELLGDQEQTGDICKILPFEPEPAVYVIKNIKKQPPTTKDLLDNKAFTAYRLNVIDSMGLGLIHFNPENIIKRTSYKPLKDAVPAGRMLEPEQMPDIGD